MWIELFKFLGGSVLIIGSLTYLSKRLIEHSFSKDLEAFKADLQKESIRHKTKFETLHAERANVIKEIYKKIVKTNQAFESLISPLQLAGEPIKEEKTKILVEQFNSLSVYFAENRLFFEEDLAEEINKLITKFIDIWHQWNYANDLRDTGKPDAKEWGKTWDQVKNEIPPIKQKIEKEFRELIGVVK